MSLNNIKRCLEIYRPFRYRQLCTESQTGISVKDFYKDRTILVTGSTGFVGQCLVEKLIRSCPDIKRVYLPIRATKTADANQRFDKLVSSSVFDRLRQTNPSFSQKLIPLAASLEDSNLGLSDDMLTHLKEEVSVIFHVAALIKFSPPLREAVQSNVLVSTNVFRFGKQCNQLAAYIHTSTLFLHADLHYVEERIYPTKWTHEDLLNLPDTKLDSKQVKTDITGKSLNIYYASKRVVEYMTKLERDSMPVAVVRPGKVSPSLSEPVPGWSQGFASYIPWMTLVEKGEIRIHMGRDSGQDEIIPVDLCANTLINTAWYIGTNQKNVLEERDPFVVNLHSSKLEYMTTKYIVSILNRCLTEDGRNGTVYLDSSRIRLFLRAALPTLWQTIQALAKGKRPNALLVYAFVFFEKGIYKIQLNNNPKEFHNLDGIVECLSDHDLRDFPCDLTTVDWDNYVRTWFYKLKERREKREMKQTQKGLV